MVIEWETQVLGDGTGCGKGRPGCACNMIAAVCKQFNCVRLWMTWLPASRNMCALCSCNSLQLFPSLGWDEVGNVLGIYFRLLQGNLCFAIPHVELWAQTSRCPGFRMKWNAWTSSSFLILTFQGPFGSQQQAWTPKFIGICNVACGLWKMWTEGF